MDDFRKLSSHWPYHDSVYGDWLVVFQVDEMEMDLMEESNLHVLHQTIEAFFGPRAVNLFQTGGCSAVLIHPDATNVIEFAHDLKRSYESTGVLSQADYNARVDLAVESLWHTMPVSRRIAVCRRAGVDMSQVLQTDFKQIDFDLVAHLTSIISGRD